MFLEIELICHINHCFIFNSIESLIGTWRVQSAQFFDVFSQFDVIKTWQRLFV